MQAPKALQEATRKNLDKLLKDLVSGDEILSVTDPCLPNIAVSIKIFWLP